MAAFSVLLLTAPPPGHTADPNGPFVKIDGRESLLRCAELFLSRENVKQIQMVFPTDNFEDCKKKYGGHLSFSGVKVLSAGPKWIDQFAAAGDKIAPEATHVIVHDTARPAVAYSDIEALMEAADKHAVVSLATTVRSTLVEVDAGGGALAIRMPGEFMNLVTPQCYAREKFIELAKAKSEPHASQITLVKGSSLNVRLGGGDASLLKAMINMLPKPKIKGPMSPFEEAQW